MNATILIRWFFPWRCFSTSWTYNPTDVSY